jgi:hypothetical protein
MEVGETVGWMERAIGLTDGLKARVGPTVEEVGGANEGKNEGRRVEGRTEGLVGARVGALLGRKEEKLLAQIEP